MLSTGNVALRVSNVGEELNTVIRLLKPDGSRDTQITIPGEEFELDLAAGPDGWLYIASEESLRRWKPGGNFEVVATGDAWYESGAYWAGSMAIGADGKSYGVDLDGIGRFDPATGVSKIVVGAGAEGSPVDPEELGNTLEAPSFDGAGNMYVLDAEYRQIKRIAAGSI